MTFNSLRVGKRFNLKKYKGVVFVKIKQGYQGEGSNAVLIEKNGKGKRVLTYHRFGAGTNIGES